MGIAIASYGRGVADRAAVAWLARAPSPRELEVVGSLLMGLWSQVGAAGRVEPAAVASLIRVRQGLDLDESDEYNYLVVLTDAMRHELPAALREQLSSLLRSARGRSFEAPHLRAALGALLSAINGAAPP